MLRPSQLLQVEDETEAFDLDAALALRGDLDDKRHLQKLFQQLNDNIIKSMNENTLNLAKAMGAKVKKKAPKREKEAPTPGEYQTLPENIKEVDKLPSIEQALMALGGRGVVKQ